MKDDVRAIFDAYDASFAKYRPAVPVAHPARAAAEKTHAELRALAEAAADASVFMQSAVGAMTRFSQELTELAKAAQAHADPATIRWPSVAEAAQGYHAAYEALLAATGPEDRARRAATVRLYERIFAIEAAAQNTAEFMARLAEEGLFVQLSAVDLVAVSTPLIADADAKSLPAMAAHHRYLIEAAQKARSAVELDYEARRLLFLNRVEMVWDQALVLELQTRVGSPLASWLLTHSEEHRAEVEAAVRFVALFFGLHYRQVYELPRVRDYLEKFFLPAINKERTLSYTFESYCMEMIAGIDTCLKDRPPLEIGPEKRQSVQCWGKRYRVSDALKLARKPPRPEELNA